MSSTVTSGPQGPPQDHDDLAQKSANMPSPEDNWTPPTREDLRKELKHEESKEERKHVWKDYDRDVKECYDTLLKRWQKEMDNLLVFGGLFAAVLTPFNVESYTSLQPDPTDPSLAILQQISAQLNSFSINSGFINSTAPSLPLPDIEPAFRPSDSAILINKLWFSSLICTLASSSIALIVKQWLFELSTGLPGESRPVARRRQYRYNTLQKWHVGTIVVIPSLLLQAALILFLSGLLVLLWSLHSGVATISSILVGALFLFLVVVTVLPTIASTCCYGSPQARILYPIPRWILRQISEPLLGFLQSRDYESVASSGKSLKRLDYFYKSLYDFLESRRSRSPTWKSREEHPIMQEANTLDRTTAVMAFTTTLDDKYLQDLRLVLRDIPTEEFSLVFDDIAKALPAGGANASRPDDQRHALAAPLTSALRYLLIDTDPLQADTRQAAISLKTCKSLLPRLNVTEPIDKNAIVDVAFLIPDLLDNELSQGAYKILLEALDLRDDGPPNQCLTYRSLRYAMLMLERDMAQRDSATDDYDLAIARQLKMIRGVLHCVLDALASDSPLLPAEAQIICEHGRRLISTFKDNWASLDWKRVLGLPTDYKLAQPQPSLSSDILRFVWLPLRQLCHVPRRDGKTVITETMLTTLMEAVSSAKDARGPIREEAREDKWEDAREDMLQISLEVLRLHNLNSIQ